MLLFSFLSDGTEYKYKKNPRLYSTTNRPIFLLLGFTYLLRKPPYHLGSCPTITLCVNAMVEVINTSEDANASHLGQSNTSQLVLERSESPESCDLRECYTSESGYPLAPLAFTLPCEALSTTDANTKKTERLRKSPIQSSRWFSSLDHPGLRTDFNKLIVKWWIWELLGCFGSLLSFFAIVGVLMYYDGRGQPEWPYNITINSVLSWLTTAMKAFLLFSVAACIGQANWLHFRARPHALVDLIAYDSASRGPFGSVQLLWRLRAK